jgi:methionyl-tRNA formyltransferase
MDAGPILIRRETMIKPTETAGELHDRLARIGCDAIDATLRLLDRNRHHPGTPQDESLATQAPKLKKSDGYVNFEETAEQIARRCRAMWPWPGAKCLYIRDDKKSEEITIALAVPVSERAAGPPGMITKGYDVVTGEGMLRIHTLKPAGKKVMGWRDFVNGRKVKQGDRFEPMREG